MSHITLSYWPVITFLCLHGLSFLWSYATLHNRVKSLERELDNYKNVHERLAKLEATSFAVAESVRRIEAHLLRRAAP